MSKTFPRGIRMPALLRNAILDRLGLPRPKRKPRRKPFRLKNPAAVELGRLGGIARAAKLSEERRQEIARQGAMARWKKERRRQRRREAARASAHPQPY